ncbi:hypothetical protein SEVIR_2G400800v4 [Setaria viridis]|uniref:Uncharacterized protein n=1 Tax=Setaria viridis TaxID=4556 RepID=A0A4U6W0E0_SETVI|nr:hypothetical protein SEVIR_2G400800v2 [Setaria viridis]
MLRVASCRSPRRPSARTRAPSVQEFFAAGQLLRPPCREVSSLFGSWNARSPPPRLTSILATESPLPRTISFSGLSAWARATPASCRPRQRLSIVHFVEHGKRTASSANGCSYCSPVAVAPTKCSTKCLCVHVHFARLNRKWKQDKCHLNGSPMERPSAKT